MFDKLKGLFIVTEEEDKKNVPQKKKEEPKPRVKPKVEQPPVIRNTGTTDMRPPVVGEGKVSEKFMGIFLGAMEKNNLQGFDYLEFKQSLQGLSKMPMDEATRYKSAFVMASSMGVTVNSLMETAKHYLNVLEKEDKKFEQALKQQNQNKIGRQKQELAAMEKAVAEKAEQIKRLTQEIAQIQSQMGNKKQQVMQAEAKVEQTKNNFIASYNAIRGQIEADMENMKRYLVG